ncbi:MAG: CopG family transcriptional regulator [Bacillota bacterium]|jgi:hypothetical protein
MSEQGRMHRMQFYIEPRVRDELASLAERRSVSMAQLIREAILSLVAREAHAPDDDPLLDIVGMIDSPAVPVDAAENHDRYIYRKDWED